MKDFTLNNSKKFEFFKLRSMQGIIQIFDISFGLYNYYRLKRYEGQSKIANSSTKELKFNSLMNLKNHFTHSDGKIIGYVALAISKNFLHCLMGLHTLSVIKNISLNITDNLYLNLKI